MNDNERLIKEDGIIYAVGESPNAGPYKLPLDEDRLNQRRNTYESLKGKLEGIDEELSNLEDQVSKLEPERAEVEKELQFFGDVFVAEEETPSEEAIEEESETSEEETDEPQETEQEETHE